MRSGHFYRLGSPGMHKSEGHAGVLTDQDARDYYDLIEWAVWLSRYSAAMLRDTLPSVIAIPSTAGITRFKRVAVSIPIYWCPVFLDADSTDISMAHDSRLIIVCGLPGAGKTILAKELEQRHDAVRFSADEWMDALAISLWDERSRARIESLQWTIAEQLLTRGQTVIIEWGTWARSERDALRIRARELGAAVELRYVRAPIDVLFERVQRRRMEDPPMTREQLVRFAATFMKPTDDELHLYDEPAD